MTLNVAAFEMTAEPISQLPIWAEKRRTPLPRATASARFSRPSTSISRCDVRRVPVEKLEDVGHGPAEPSERVPGDRPELGRALFSSEGLPEVRQGDAPVTSAATEGQASRAPGRT